VRPTLSQSTKKVEEDMTLRLTDLEPNFDAETTQGKINFHKWAGDSWVVLFSHPKDFTPDCTTELGPLESIKPEFDKRNVTIIGLSVDPISDHKKWSEDIKEVTGYKPSYPIIGDENLHVAKLYGLLPGSTSGSSKGRTAVDNQTVRTVYVIGPDKKVKLLLTYPMATGRNFLEILRVIDSIQLTVKYKVATPAGWKQGEDVIIVPAVKDDEAKKLFPEGWKAVKPYLRIIKQPGL